MKFNELQKLLSEKLDIVHLSDIARELSVTPQVVNNWKKRDKIPYKYVKKIRQIEKASEKRKGFNSDDLNIIRSLNKLSSSDSLVEGDENITKDIVALFIFFKKILFNNYKFIFLFTSLIVFLTIIYVSYFSPIIYKTTMTILPIKSEKNDGNIGGIASQFGINLSQSSNNLSSVRLIPDLIRSKSLLKGLLNRDIYFSTVNRKKSLMEHYFGINDSSQLNLNFYTIKGIEKIQESISIANRKANDLIDVTVNFSDPKGAVDICYGIFEELDKIQKQINLSRTKEKISYISERLSTVKGDLKITEEALKDFRENNRNIANSPSLTLAENRLIREVASISAIYNTLKSQFEINRVEELGSTKLIQMIDSPSLPIYRSSPRKKRSVIFALIIGFSASVLTIYLKELYPKIKEEIVQ